MERRPGVDFVCLFFLFSVLNYIDYNGKQEKFSPPYRYT